MNAFNSNLTNRLILLLLCLNLVCLVLVLARVYRKPAEPEARVALDPPQAPSARPKPIVYQFERPSGETDQTSGQARLTRKPGQGLVRTSSTPASPRASGVSQAAPPVEAIPAPVTSPVLVNLPSGTQDARVPPVAASGGRRSQLNGRVFLNGVPPPEIPIQMGPLCGNDEARTVTTRHYVAGPDGGLANVLVWLISNDLTGPITTPSPVLDQVGCMFQPYVLGVVTGQTFVIRNSDPLLHNVHATPKLNAEFNFGQVVRGQSNIKSFRTPELFIRIKCDVHPWMFAYVNVLPHPYFSITDTNGYFEIPDGFPPGRYAVGAAHLKAGAVDQFVELREGEQRTLTFELTPDRSQARAR